MGDELQETTIHKDIGAHYEICSQAARIGRELCGLVRIGRELCGLTYYGRRTLHASLLKGCETQTSIFSRNDQEQKRATNSL